MNNGIQWIIGILLAILVIVSICVGLSFLPPLTPFPEGTESSMQIIRTDITNITTIYAIQCPFGQYYADVEGHFGRYGGSISTSLAEDYVLKYMDGKELKTEVMPIKQSKVIVDGKFYVSIIKDNYGIILESATPTLEAYVTQQRERWDRTFIFDDSLGKYVMPYRQSDYFTPYKITYEIHIPYLPETEQLTDNWGGTT